MAEEHPAAKTDAELVEAMLKHTRPVGSAAQPRYRAAVDTPLGVTFHDFYALGKGGVIVTQTVERKIAEQMGFKPTEVELVTVTDNETGALLWPKD